MRHFGPTWTHILTKTLDSTQAPAISNSDAISTDHQISPPNLDQSRPNFNPSLALIMVDILAVLLCKDLCRNGHKFPFFPWSLISSYLLVPLSTRAQYRTINCPGDGVYYCCAVWVETCTEMGTNNHFLSHVISPWLLIGWESSTTFHIVLGHSILFLFRLSNPFLPLNVSQDQC